MGVPPWRLHDLRRKTGGSIQKCVRRLERSSPPSKRSIAEIASYDIHNLIDETHRLSRAIPGPGSGVRGQGSGVRVPRLTKITGAHWSGPRFGRPTRATAEAMEALFAARFVCVMAKAADLAS